MSTAPLPEIFALFGQPVAGNPTQEMMERAFRAAGLNWRYLSLEIAPDDLADAILGMRAMRFKGAHITKPHKVAVIPHVDRLTEAATKIGAVNCIVRQGNTMLGDNTDGKGFVESLQAVTDPRGKRVVLLGAGGAARAIGVEAALAGVGQITVVNRTAERGEALARLLAEQTPAAARFEPWTDDYTIAATTDILINATSIGMDAPEERVPVSLEHLTPGTAVADVVINPPDTRFLQEARAVGAVTLEGLGMLVDLGAISFRLWTGKQADKDVMRQALVDSL